MTLLTCVAFGFDFVLCPTVSETGSLSEQPALLHLTEGVGSLCRACEEDEEEEEESVGLESYIGMKWLTTVRSLFNGRSRSAPTTPVSSPCVPSKRDLSAKQVGRS